MVGRPWATIYTPRVKAELGRAYGGASEGSAQRRELISQLGGFTPEELASAGQYDVRNVHVSVFDETGAGGDWPERVRLAGAHRRGGIAVPGRAGRGDEPHRRPNPGGRRIASLGAKDKPSRRVVLERSIDG